jgi:hypothetical protein
MKFIAVRRHVGANSIVPTYVNIEKIMTIAEHEKRPGSSLIKIDENELLAVQHTIEEILNMIKKTESTE